MKTIIKDFMSKYSLTLEDFGEIVDLSKYKVNKLLSKPRLENSTEDVDKVLSIIGGRDRLISKEEKKIVKSRLHGDNKARVKLLNSVKVEHGNLQTLINHNKKANDGYIKLIMKRVSSLKDLKLPPRLLAQSEKDLILSIIDLPEEKRNKVLKKINLDFDLLFSYVYDKSRVSLKNIIEVTDKINNYLLSDDGKMGLTNDDILFINSFKDKYNISMKELYKITTIPPTTMTRLLKGEAIRFDLKIINISKRINDYISDYISDYKSTISPDVIVISDNSEKVVAVDLVSENNDFYKKASNLLKEKNKLKDELLKRITSLQEELKIAEDFYLKFQ